MKKPKFNNDNDDKIYQIIQKIYEKGQKEWYASAYRCGRGNNDNNNDNNDNDDYFSQMVDEVSRVVLLTLTRKGTLNNEAAKYVHKEFHEKNDENTD